MAFIDLKPINWADIRGFLIVQSGNVLLGSLTLTTHVTEWLGFRIIDLSKFVRVGLHSASSYWNCLPIKALHQDDSAINVAARLVTGNTEIIEPISDVIGAIAGKQVMIIGEMGTGKSTLAQYLAYTIGGQLKVYECEGTPEDWQGLEVIGKGEDWDSINAGMQADLEDLSNQLKIRNDKGDSALAGSEKVIICEEYPELVSKVECSGEWLERHARRGRKARRFTILLSQYDRVSAWGLEGKSDLGEAFFRIRLGKKAIAHAKSLKNLALISWLKADRQHCLLDDEPLLLPPYREQKAVTQRFVNPYALPTSSYHQPATTSAQLLCDEPPEAPLEVDSSDLEALEGEFLGGEKALWEMISALLEGGRSEYWIIHRFWGCTGGSGYRKAQNKIQELRSRFSDESR